MGEGKDVVYLENMKAVKRTVVQGPGTIEFEYSDKNISVLMMGKKTETPIEGAFLSDGGGFDLSIARLPLADNYEISFYMFDAMTMKLKTMKLKVLGKEDSLWKVNIQNVEDEKETQTLWICPEKEMAVKHEITVPAMGNAKITITLKS